MASLPRLSLRRPVATLMAYLILMVVGVVSFLNLPVDLLPRIEFTQLTVRVRYPNVGPQEIEQIITNRIENVVAGLPNLERVNSLSEEGFSRVRLDFARGTNLDEAANDLRAALDRVRDELPLEAEPPEILKLDLDNVEVLSLVATSTRHLEELTRILDRELSRRLKQVPGVGSVELTGGVYRQIRVDLQRERLRAAGLTALDVEEALARDNLTVPGGNVKSGLSDLYVRPMAEYQTVAEVERTVIRTVDGRPIRVGDVAQVIDGYQDVRYLVEVNGVPSVTVTIQKQSGANTVDVARRLRQEVERINQEREDIHLTISSDSSEFIRQSIDNVKQSALWGSLLALLILYLFLRSGTSTAIIGVSIPISIIACFALLYFGGLTLNQMTFGGLALGVGMMVDNAIVVLENIVRKREESGSSPDDAASVGASEVAGAMLASTLTTCVVFIPLVFMQSVSGALFKSLALVVIFCQACSLVVGFTVVPVLAARMLRRGPAPAGLQDIGTRRRATGNGMVARLERWYGRRLKHAIQHRGRIFAITGVLVVAAMALWPLIPVELAPQTDADEVDVELEMAQGTNMAVVRAYVDEIEAKVRQALPPGQVELISTEIRGGDAEVELRLVPADRRSMSGADIADRLRRAVDGQIPGGEVEVNAQPGLWILRRIFSSGGGQQAVEVELRGWDIDRSDQIAAEMRRRMERVPGLTGVRVSRREGRPEERLRLDRERIAELGLSVREVARAVQANVGGIEAGRLRDDGEEYPILVRLQPEDRLTAQDLDPASLRTPAGAMVPLVGGDHPRAGPGADGHLPGRWPAGHLRDRRPHRRGGPGGRHRVRARGADRPRPAPGIFDRVRGRIPGAAGSPARLHHRHRDGGGAGVHADGRAVRAVDRSADRDAVGAGGADWRGPCPAADRHQPEHPERDGPGDAGRGGGQQRHRAGRQREPAPAGAEPAPGGGRDGSRPAAAAPHLDEHRHRRAGPAAHGPGLRRRGGDPGAAGPRGDRRSDRVHPGHAAADPGRLPGRQRPARTPGRPPHRPPPPRIPAARPRQRLTRAASRQRDATRRLGGPEDGPRRNGDCSDQTDERDPFSPDLNQPNSDSYLTSEPPRLRVAFFCADAPRGVGGSC